MGASAHASITIPTKESGRLDSFLLTLEVADVEVGFDVECHHFVFRQVAVDHRVQLPELGEGGHPHPDLEPLGVHAHHGGHHFGERFVQVLVVVVLGVRKEVVRVGFAAVVAGGGRRAVVGAAARVHARGRRAGVGAAVRAGGGPHARLGRAAGVDFGLEAGGLLVLGRVRCPRNAVVGNVLVGVEDDFVCVWAADREKIKWTQLDIASRIGKNHSSRQL